MQRGGTCFQKGWYPADCQPRRPKLVAGMIIVVWPILTHLHQLGIVFYWQYCFDWQACHVVEGGTGLIPSQFLEEKRKAFVPKDLDGAGDTLKHYCCLNIKQNDRNILKLQTVFERNATYMYFAFTVLTSILVKTM